VKVQGPNPLRGGGHADVYKGDLDNRKVAVKVMRLFTSGKGVTIEV
jgi:hypothetical protein